MSASQSKVFLIPCYLYEGVNETIPAYVVNAIKECDVFFVENERTTRRFFKSLWREMVIDDYQWHTIHKAEVAVMLQFEAAIKAGKNIGIASEAGCPGIADPGQILINKAQQLGALVNPLVGPSSILLALMACGMNGQSFKFNGYLPIDGLERKKAIQHLEEDTLKSKTTHLFIETPYRNDTMLKAILDNCKPTTRLCIAADITSDQQSIKTLTMAQWKQNLPALHKKQVVFLIGV